MSQTEKKKLGFRDKIKKMLESDSPREKKKSIIEETSVKFTLTGGNVHSELLVAEAIMDSKNDNNYGMPLPIICKWYNKSKTDEITEIEGITGAFYQPNADDINTYIIVEAKPILEESEYHGEFLRKEIGPIVIDKQIQEEVQELLETGKFKIAAKLESINNPQLSKDDNEKKNEQYSFPKQCTLLIDTDKVQIQVQDEERINATCPLGQFYPSIKIIKRTNNVFELYFSQTQVYRLQAQSNTHRDVITVALRMFCGKKLIQQQDINDDSNEDQISDNNNNENKLQQNINQSEDTLKQDELSEKQNNGDIQLSQNSDGITRKSSGSLNQSDIRPARKHQTQASTSESYEVFVKLNELTKKTVDLEQIRDDLKIQVQELSEDNKKKTIKLEEYEIQLLDVKEKLKQQQEINEQYKSKHSQYMNEKLFLTQELQVIQQEIEGKNREIDENKQDIEILKKKLELKKDVVDEEGVQSLHNTIADIVGKLNKQIDHNKNLEQLLSEKEKSFNLINNDKEDLENEVLHLKKKYECLLQEKQIIIPNSQKSLDSPNTNRQSNNNNNNVSSHHSINFNKKDEDSTSDKADNDNSSNFSGHNHFSKSQNVPPQFNLGIKLSPLPFSKSQSSVSPQLNNQHKNNHSNGSSQILGNNNIVIKHPEQLQDFELLKNQLQQKIEENHNLNKKVLQLETTLETISQAYTQDVKSINSPTKRKLKESGNEQILQKLVNSLTEMITEKDLALDNQKKINKELINKISELSVNKS